MWHVLSDGFGGFLVYKDDPGADALAGGMLNVVFFGIAALFAWLIWVMGDAIMLPLACLVLLFALGVLGLALGADFGGFMTVLAIALTPVLMYAWACLCWGMIYVFDHVEGGYMAFIAYLLAGLFMLVLVAMLFLDGLESPVLAVVFAVAQLAIWWAAMGARSYGNEGVAFVLKYTFRVLGIISLGCLALIVVGVLVNLFRTLSGGKGFDGKALAGNLGTVALSVVPMLACGLLGGVGGLVPCIVMLVMSAVLAGGLVCLRKESSINLSGLTVAYLAFFFCYLLTQADLSIAVPLDAGNTVISVLRSNGLVQAMGTVFYVVGSSLAGLFTAVTDLVLSLLFRIFDAAAPDIPFNATMSGLLGYVVLCGSISVGATIAEHATKK